MDIMSSGVAPVAGGVRVGDSLYSGFAPAADGRVLAYQTLFYSSATSPAQATPVTLRSGEERTGLNFQLRVVPTSRIAGTLTGPDGPAGSVGVRLLPASEDLIGDTGFETATTATSADGAFVFLGVPPGQYVAKVLKQPRPQIPAELASSPLLGMSFGPGMTAAPTGTAAMTLFAQAPITVAGTDVTGVVLALSEGIRVSGRIVFDGTAQKPTPQQMQQMSVTLQSADEEQRRGRGISGEGNEERLPRLVGTRGVGPVKHCPIQPFCGGVVSGGCVGVRPVTTSQSPATLSASSATAVSFPGPQRSVSVPRPPTRRSFPAPPTRVSLPLKPVRLVTRRVDRTMPLPFRKT
jgi:hypothetical protein